MFIRIGELLVRNGVLTPDQVDQIVEAQAGSARPFGVLAEEMFNIDAEHIEQAWIEQYATITLSIDVRDHQIDAEVRHYVDRRQAWQFGVLPVRFDGQELMVATTRPGLARALRFTTRCLEVPCYLVLAEADALSEVLDEVYPMAGMTPDALNGRAFGEIEFA